MAQRAPSLRTRLGAAILAWASAGTAATFKDGEGGIWGGAFQTFMGMQQGGTGPQQVTDSASDYAGSRTADSYVFTAEQVRSRAVSQVPLRVWRFDADGKKRDAVEHDALGVLQQTNPYGYVDGVPALMRMTLSSLDFQGRAAWKLSFSRRKIPTEIYWQAPTQWAPLPDKTRFFRGIRVRDEDGVREIPAEELCYFTTDNPLDPLLGTSRIACLKNPLNLRAYSQWNNIDFHRNSMRPDWMLSGSFANTEDNIARIRRSIRRMLSGANNRAPLILGEGMTAHLLTTSHEDAQWVEQQRLAQEEISAVFGVPLIYLNNLERATYENIRTAKVLLWHDTMIPELDDLADRLNRRYLWRFWPDTRERRYAFGWDYDEIEGLGEDLALVWERVVSMSKQISEQVKNRELTPHEARILRSQLYGDLGIDTAAFQAQIPGGDQFFESFQTVPVDELSIQALMNVWAMRGNNPEFVESVPGAETAGNNADQVAERLNQPAPAPLLPPGAAPGLPPGQGTPRPPQPGAQPAEPAKGLTMEDLRQQMAAEIQQTVGEAAVRAFGAALQSYQAPQPVPDQAQLERRLKRYFQDQQTEVLRTLRVAQAAGAPVPSDLYSRRVYRDRLAELTSPETADQVEAVTQAALRAAAGDRARVTTVFRDAIDRRAREIAAGKALQPVPGRPLQEQVVLAERHHAEAVAGALRGGINVHEVAGTWARWHTQGKAAVEADLVQAALDYLKGLGLDLSGLAPVIRAIYQDGWRLGIGAGLRWLSKGGFPSQSADPAAGIDWAAWTPGDRAAAEQAAQLSTLLDQADVVIKGIDDTTLERLAQVLAQGAAAGDSVATIARGLEDLLGDPGRAGVIAQTELARAQSAASLETYRGNGIEGKGWITFEPCPICAQNQDVVLPLDGVFPSGDMMPPAHPRCVCSLTPETLGPEDGGKARAGIHAKEILYETARRGSAHDHSTDPGERPVIVVDLHGTITPSHGFTAPGEPGSMLAPFEGCREALDALVAGGCCVHLATAAISPQHADDVLAARRRLIDGYLAAHGLPISFVTGKVGAHVYYDDRMVPARARPWPEILAEVIGRLGKRFDQGSDGIWRRKDIPETGHDYEQPQPDDIAPDQPRGLSTPIVDIDLHRCLLQASSSKLEAGLKPGALEAVRELYDAGYTVHLSCAGWDPTTHDPAESAQRLAAMRQQVRAFGVPYDELVSKDHPDVAIDDKGVHHADWERDLPILRAALGTPHPEDEVTSRPDAPAA